MMNVVKRSKINNIEVIFLDEKPGFSNHRTIDGHVYVVTGGINLYTLCTILGIDYSKVDAAYPVNFVPEKEGGLCWSYDNDNLFGQPLYYKDMFEELDRKVLEEWNKIY